MIRFEKVKRFADADFDMPIRKTANSAGYDMVVAEDITIPTWTSHLMTLGKITPQPIEGYDLDELSKLTKQTKAKPTLVSTGVKCYLEEGYYLELSVRSSTPLKHWIILANSVGIIDADYADNPDNEGEIFFQVINLSPFPIQLRKGDIIGQGIIKKYEVTDDDKAEGLRQGGFGSTSVQRGLRAKADIYDEAITGYNDPMPCTSSGKQINVNLDFTAEIEKVMKELDKCKPPEPVVIPIPTCYNFEAGM